MRFYIILFKYNTLIANNEYFLRNKLIVIFKAVIAMQMLDLDRIW